jgi:enoyl-CoA hydratase/carnithine racemase
MTANKPAALPSLAVKLDRQCLTITLRGCAGRGRLDDNAARELIALAERADDDERVLIVALTGKGAAFCRGIDGDSAGRAVESIAALSKPTIAIINGAAIDEGLELALACDIRLATGSARFALTQLTRGTLPRCGATQRLPRIIGPAHALRMILSGACVYSTEAARLGLVSAVASDRAELERAAENLMDTLTARAPLALRLAKEAIVKGYDMTLAQGVRLEEDLYALLQTTADRAEGVRAFLSKRKPLFKGL